MTILDNNLSDKLDRAVKVWNELRFQLSLPASKVLLVDLERVVDSIGNADNFLNEPLIAPEGSCFRFFDLAKAQKGDYAKILDILAKEAEGLDGVVFWNIDAIPRIAEKTELEYLVRFALKGDTVLPPRPADELSFDPMKVLAHCRVIPETIQLDGVFIVDPNELTSE